MNSLSFSASAKSENFVGRDFVFSAINNFLHRYPKGYFTIVGVPGSGKSAILAQFVRQNHHTIYYNAQIVGKNRVEAFFPEVCTQLNLLLENLSSTPPQPSPQTMTETGFINAHEGSWLFSTLLQQVSENLPDQKIIIVIDGLDGIDINSQAVGTNLFYLPRYLPDQIYFIFARRPYKKSHSGLLIEAPSQVLDLADYPVENRQDIKAYIQRNLTPLTPLPYQGMGEQEFSNSPLLPGEGLGERSNFITEWGNDSSPLLPGEGLGERSNFITEWGNDSSPLLPGEGLGERSNLINKNEDNFMYVQEVLKAMADGFYSVNNFQQIPPDLETYYQQHWQKMQGEGLSDVAVNILRVLTAEKTPAMSTVAISQIIKADVFDVAEIMETWLEFLQETHTNKETKYQLYHHSFRLYLLGTIPS
ncbi:ATP-binding protein [Dolichospermum planctonicum CS-1226]|uniref:ATP-binding protein n=1 Tax=Dolichospermum planctonicum CS-1226 TaxID=3021751 RepID=A0ABT5AJA5_9CYAN|nr:ATP-binding protein [Dolichospermum planctonicum]MDB9537379.1 ATP-binding protein [Dolichospermum planctonicum CS-1226]